MNTLLIRAVPYAIAAAVGFGLAWGIQGLRLTSAEQEFVAYKQEQVRIIQEQKDAADKQREEAAKRFSTARAELAAQVEAGDVWKRCVLAGRCAVPRNPSGLCQSSANRQGSGISSSRRTDGTGGTAVPATGQPSDQGLCEGLANDAAKVQLKLNQLQMDIKNQPDYEGGAE